jgi:hypothetical protein
MPLETEYTLGDGITVPYGPIFDDIRRNCGFIDTRKNATLAAKITESAGSAALRDLLVEIASHQQYFSLGCDLGEHQDFESPASKRFVAGGYLQLSGLRYELQQTENYDRFCGELASQMTRLAKDAYWKIRFEGHGYRFSFPANSKSSSLRFRFGFSQPTDRVTRRKSRGKNCSRR